MTDLDQWRQKCANDGIEVRVYARPDGGWELEASRTIAYFTREGRFTHWAAKDEPLMMVRTDD